MENYDPDIGYGIHTIKITLQKREYTGHLFEKVFGSCAGKEVLDFDFECGVSPKSENDCQMEYREEDDWYSVVLHNKEGATLEVSGDPEEMNQLVVGMEIIDFSPESNGGRGL